MQHRIGYACINLSTGIPLNRTCRLANASEDKLLELIKSNIDGLDKVLRWNVENNIFHFRISSDIIPFASHEVNKVKWWQVFSDDLTSIGKYIEENNIRVAMHPSQIVNINSPRTEVVDSSVKELDWHVKLLDTMGLSASHKVVFHTGGVYGDKTEAVKRFVKVYKTLPNSLKNRLTLENDDKSYTVCDVIRVNQETGIPLVFDNLHHEVLNEGKEEDKDIESILKSFFSTWDYKKEIPDIHYSSQKKNARPGSHAESIDIKEFQEFYNKFKHLDFDIMLETKDKDISALQVIKTIFQ